MNSFVLRALTFCFCFLASQVSAQFALDDNDSGVAATDSFPLILSDELQNDTTTFDEVNFRITRVLIEPTDLGAIRVIGELTNLSSKEAQLLRFIPGPRLVDEMGNFYVYSGVSGLNRCVHQRLTDGRFNDNPPELHKCKNYDDNAQWSNSLPENTPVTLAVVFAIPNDGSFNFDLASLSSTATFDIRFVHSRDNFETVQLHEVVIPGVPIPSGHLK